MSIKSFRILSAALLTTWLAVTALADRVDLADGSVVHGKIVSAEGGKLKIETGFAGMIEIAQEAVSSFTTDEAVNVSLASGSTVVGKVARGATGIKVDGANAALTGGAAEVTALWRMGAESPSARIAREAAEKAARKWAYEAGVAIAGRTGGSEKFSSLLAFKATLASEHDKLIFAAESERAQDNGTKTADRYFGSVDYSSFFSKDNGWYVRSSLEKDKIKALDLRATAGFGFSRKLIKKEMQDLEARVGVSYVYETYTNNTEFDSPGLDVGFLHSYTFGTAKMTNTLIYTPAFKEFSNFRLTHVSAVEMPLTAALWKLKVGLYNEYQSVPPAGVDRLDTTYFTSLILNWK